MRRCLIDQRKEEGQGTSSYFDWDARHDPNPSTGGVPPGRDDGYHSHHLDP